MKSYISITRPFNCLFVALSVFIGAVLKQIQVIDYSWFIILQTVLSAMIIAAAGYVVNDYYDLPLDRINKPNRVLPQGKMKPERALHFSLFLFILGIIISVTTGVLSIIIVALINSLILFYYAKIFKRTVLIGNLFISWATASVFIYGSLATGNLPIILPIFVYTFFYTLTREMIKDAEDISGDIRNGITTLATKFGERFAIILSIIPVSIVIVLLFLGYRYETLDGKLFYSISFLFAIPLIIMYIFLFNRLETKFIRVFSQVSKLHMLLLLIVYASLA